MNSIQSQVTPVKMHILSIKWFLAEKLRADMNIIPATKMSADANMNNHAV